MSNIVNDIVTDYNHDLKNGIHEAYYKKDIVEGLKIIITIIGIAKLMIAFGSAAAAIIGSVIGWVGNHPQAAARCAQAISKYGDEIEDVISFTGKKFNEAYNALSEKEKKYVRTVVLLVAKDGIDWDNLH